jgi:hypothetical protein
MLLTALIQPALPHSIAGALGTTTLGVYPLPVHRIPTDTSITRPSRRRWLRPFLAAGLIATVVTASALASTPVTNGFRDQAYGGGAFRPTSEKPQSKLWYTDGTWFAGMFVYRPTASPTISEYRIHRLDRATDSWVDTGVVIDTRDTTHADYLWSESTQTLWVASGYEPAVGATIDGTRIYKFTYVAGTNTYTLAPGFPSTIPLTASGTPPGFQGGAHAVTLARATSGRLWAVWTKNAKVEHSTSTDDGATWSNPADVPVPVTPNPIRQDGVNGDISAVIRFGDNIGIMWSDHDALPTADDDGFYFALIADGADPTVPGNWSLEKLPTLVPGAPPREVADDHINLKATSDGTVYMVGKTGKDTAGCATNKQLPLVEAFRRTTAGVWSAHLVSTVGDCNTRPQLLLDEQLGVAYVFLTAPNGGGTIYMKSAPLGGPEALKFRGDADQTIQRGTPFIRSASETAIDDPTTMKQTANSGTGIVVLANNLATSDRPNPKVYLHNDMAIPTSDATAPTGTVSIAAGVAFTKTTSIVASLSASDAGSGMSLVRLSNSAAVSGGLLTTGTTFNYQTTIAWDLGAGADGLRTLYAQFRDASGNWSTPVSDTITLDTAAPTGTVLINGGDATATSSSVALNLTASDGAGSGVASVLASNTTDFSSATPQPFAATVPWTLTAGDGTKTVYVKFVDALGNTSGAPVTDTIVVDALPTGSVVINGGASLTNSPSVNLTFPSTSGDVTDVRVGSTSDLSAVGWQTFTQGMTLPFSTPVGDGTKTVYAQFRDAGGGISSPVSSDTITLDQSAPTGSVSINNGAATTTSTNATLTFPTVGGDPALVRVGTSSDLSAVAYQTFTAGMSLPLQLTAGDGTKTAYAQFRDAAGNDSVVYSDTITLNTAVDTTKPTVPGRLIHRIAGAVTTGFPIRLNWAASTDTGSGIAYYILQQSVNGAAYTTIGHPSATLVDLQLSSSSKTYRYRVAARDNDGNVSPYSYSLSFKTISTSESGAAMKYTRSWPLSSSTAYIGGKAKYSKVTGATATLTFKGNRVAWLSQKGPTSGVARVYVDGKLKATVNLYSATTINKQVVWQYAWTAVTTRTVRVVVVGTAGHPKVLIDQFFSVR